MCLCDNSDGHSMADGGAAYPGDSFAPNFHVSYVTSGRRQADQRLLCHSRYIYVYRPRLHPDIKHDDVIVLLSY